MSRALLLLFMLFNANIAHSANPASILVLGDSLSAAYGMNQQQGWVALLQARLSSHGYAQRITNASISGETTAGGLGRLPVLLRQHQPAIVILELGANDGLRGLPIAQIRYNLSKAVQQAQASGASVLLLGMRLPPNYGSQYTEQFAEVYQDIARRHRVALHPFLLEGVATQSWAMQSDGIHPNAQAQPQLAENVWSRLQHLIRKQP